jgi:sialate O-acetylesterase
MKILLTHMLMPLVLAVLFPALVMADVRLPRILSDGVILQRDKPITIWGWADEGERVTVKFAGKEKLTVTQNGSWSVSFPALKAGGNYELIVKGKNIISLKNIVMGDLWIAAGQSNMELPLNRVRYRYPEVLASTNQLSIREFNVPVAYAFKGPEQDFKQGMWKTATPENIASFSAVGFFFMQSVYQQTQVPIGLITIPVGGAPAEAWVSEDALAKYPHYVEQLRPFKDDVFVQNTIAMDKASNDKWYGELNAADEGLKNNWSAEKLDTSHWRSLTIPGFLKEQGFHLPNGSFWARKTFYLTDEQAKKSAALWLGCVVDGDQVFLNGQSIGQTGYQYPPRIYAVPANLLKAGDNNLSVRVVSYSGNPGFVKEKPYELNLGDEKIALSGEWKMQIAATAKSMNKTTTLHYQPSSLFNAKLAPALPLKIKGVLWYQGESNVGRANEYQQLLPDLITDWRKQFNQGDFPFLYVQLANFLLAQAQPSESGWAELREAQRKMLAVKNTAMTVALDLGEWNDIHPLNKKEVGERLALSAMKLAYGKKSIIHSGPLVKSAKLKSKKIELTFDYAKGLTVRGDHIKYLAIAGADKKFVWTTAEVNNNRLIVDAAVVADPKWIRYAWADNPEGANLYNAAGLPASSFEMEVK